MRLISQLELADCRAIVAAAQSEAAQRQAVVSVAVVDAGGHPLLVERRDGASPASVEAAPVSYTHLTLPTKRIV